MFAKRKISAFLFVLTVSLLASQSKAHGVEKFVPSDATNFKVERVEVGTGRIIRQERVPYTSTEIPVYNNVYEEVLYVTVSYDSSDSTDVPNSGSGNDGQIVARDNTKPQILTILNAPPELINAIKAGRVDGRTVINVQKLGNVTVKGSRFDRTSYQYKCLYDFEYGYKLDKNCKEDNEKDPVNLSLLSITLKN